MLIPFSLGILVLYCFWQFLLLLVVFSAFGSFFRWSGCAWCVRLQAGGVWMSLGVSEWFQVTGS